MQQSDLDAMMLQSGSSPYAHHQQAPQHHPSPQELMMDFLTQKGHSQSQYDQQPHTPSATNQGPDFADLLAEFTSSGNMLSPEAMAKSPQSTTEQDMRDLLGGFSGAQNGMGGMAFEPNTVSMSNGAGAGEMPQSSNQLAQAIASMDSSTQAQLLSALLSSQQQKRQPQSQQPQPSTSAASTPNYHQRQPTSNHGSPQTFQQHHHESPQSFQPSYTTPGQSQPAPAPPQHSQAAAFAAVYQSLPTSLASSPLHSPYLSGELSHSQPSSAQPFPTAQPLAFQNAFSPRPFNPQQQQPTLTDIQAQLAIGVLGRLPNGSQLTENGQNPSQSGPDMRMRGASATGGSYATTADSEWGDDGFIFSPLMSPALTPQSVFTQASSLPPSVSTHGMGLVSPSDFFPPLGSPAMTPQYTGDPMQAWSASHSHSNSLQGLVDQTQALGFNSSALQALQQQNPNGYSPHSNASPRLVPTNSNAPSPDAGQATATGSGRRGASSKKARPSPLLKPTPDGAPKRKKTIGNTSEKRSSSIGSTGNRSATSSPFMGPSYAMTSTKTNGTGSGSSNKTSPNDNVDGSGSNNSPSPVDLALEPAGQEVMGPPPPPSLTRRPSQLNTSELMDSSVWMNPVTPATFMNFPNDLSVNTFSTLGNQQQDTSPPEIPSAMPRLNDDSADSSSTAKANKPKKVVAKGPVPLMPAPTPGSSKDAASKPPLSASATATTKGRSRSSSTSAGSIGPAGVRKIGPKPSAKGPGPSPKLKPLLPNGLPPDAAARLSTKSNYQNLLDGRGVDLLGLDPNTVSALNATQGAGADNRRTSHKAAEQKRRDSLKMCFEELRGILPPLAQSFNDEDRRPGEGNVGGQRGGSIDPDNPNRGVSKVALLRRSNEYLGVLHDRIDRRDYAIEVLRNKLRMLQDRTGEGIDEDIEELHLDDLDAGEQAAGTMAFYERLDSDNESDFKPRPTPAKRTARRKSNADSDARPRPEGSRRSSRRRSSNAGADDDEMEIEE